MAENIIGGPKTPNTPSKPAETGQAAQASGIIITPGAVTWTNKQEIYAYDRQSKLFTFKPNKESDPKCMNLEQLERFLDKVPEGNKILEEMGQNFYYPFNTTTPGMIRVPAKNPIISYSIKDKENTYFVEENTEDSTREIHNTLDGEKSSLYKTEKYEATKQGENTVYKWVELKNPGIIKETLEDLHKLFPSSTPTIPTIPIPTPQMPKPPLA